jgi:corrinoid protein of di/trimethylamine methyltransferase
MIMEDEILENLTKAVIGRDREGAASWARLALEHKIDPIKAMDALTQGIREVGEGFGSGELWLPDLVGAASAMQSAMPILEEEIEKTGAKRESLGIIVLGTVKGDIHTIGKDMVAALLRAEGFVVNDMGIDVAADRFIEAVKQYNPDILAMSALMTMTTPEQKKVITVLEEEGLRDSVKVLVGGGAITEEFAKSIGADGYGSTAPGAVRQAKQLLGV